MSRLWANLILLAFVQACSSGPQGDLSSETKALDPTNASVSGQQDTSSTLESGATGGEGSGAESQGTEETHSGTTFEIGDRKLEGDETGPAIGAAAVLGIGAVIGVVCLTQMKHGPCPPDEEPPATQEPTTQPSETPPSSPAQNSAPQHSVEVHSPMGACAPGTQPTQGLPDQILHQP